MESKQTTHEAASEKGSEMLTDEQRLTMGTWIADVREEDKDEIEYFAGAADATRDTLASYDGSAWAEADGQTDSEFNGRACRHFESVQAAKGQQRVELFVMDFGDVRAIYQA